MRDRRRPPVRVERLPVRALHETGVEEPDEVLRQREVRARAQRVDEAGRDRQQAARVLGDVARDAAVRAANL